MMSNFAVFISALKNMQYEIQFFFVKNSNIFKIKKIKININKNYKICRANKIKITEIRRHTNYNKCKL